MNTKFVNKLKAQKMIEGAGAKVNRIFPPLPEKWHFDPFVLLDEFFVEPGNGFPTHPHQGFEAITYLMGGGFRHRDNLNNDNSVFAGSAQRFTAGPGFEHSEMPAGDELSHGLQIWIRMRKAQQRETSSYQSVGEDEFPTSSFEGSSMRTIVGEGSPLKLKTAANFYDVRAPAGMDSLIKVDAEHNGFIYVLSGELEVDAQTVPKGHALFWENAAQIGYQATKECRFALFTGRPHQENIILHGPFVK